MNKNFDEQDYLIMLEKYQTVFDTFRNLTASYRIETDTIKIAETIFAIILLFTLSKLKI